MNWKYVIILLIALILTFFIGGALISQLEKGDIIGILTSIRPGYLIIGFILYVITQVLRGLRFHAILNREIGLKELWSVVFVHNMTISVLPARTGELSYIYLLRKLQGKTLGEGVSTLFVARVFDIIVITLFFYLSMLFIPDLPALFMDAVWVILFFLGVITTILLGLLFFGHHFLRGIREVLTKFSVQTSRIGTVIIEKGTLVNQGLEKVKEGRNLRLIVPVSFMIWLVLYSSVFFLLLGMHIVLPIERIILGMTFVVLSTTLPVQGFAGFGTNEGAWTLAFVPLGLSLETAIATGFSVHIMLLIFSLITGGCGFFMMRRSFFR